MKAMAALLIGLSMQACVDSEDPELAKLQQDERIDVHGCRPGTVELGEGDDFICIDPWDGIGGPGWGADEGPGWGGERPPRVPPPPPGGDFDPDATKWTCDAKCHLSPAKPGARCEGFVTGRGIGPSEPAACLAAKQDANSKVPRDCNKRHCKCRCVKGHETADCDDPITTVTYE